MEKVSSIVGAVCNGCLVYERQGQNVVVLVDTPSWYAWLETATTFTFTGEEGTFTAHKARAGNRRGEQTFPSIRDLSTTRARTILPNTA